MGITGREGPGRICAHGNVGGGGRAQWMLRQGVGLCLVLDVDVVGEEISGLSGVYVLGMAGAWRGLWR